MTTKPKTTRAGWVRKIIKPPHPGLPEKAEIAVKGADELYREIRVENTLEDGDGTKHKLKENAQVQVTIEAEPEATVPRKPPK